MNFNNDTDNEEDVYNYKKISVNNKISQLISFPENFSQNIFIKITEEEVNNYKCNFCDQITLYPKVFKNDKNHKIFCNSCCLRLNNNNDKYKDYSIDKEYSLILKQIIGNCLVSCLNFYSNCSWEGKLSELKKHIYKECKYQTIKCPNKDCSFFVLRKDLFSHLLQCDYNEPFIKCRICDKPIKRKEIESHLEICPEMLIDCDKCGKKIKRQLLDYHNGRCPEYIIKCKYWEFGCKKKIKRKFMSDHENLEIYNHYNLVNNFYKNNILEENDDIENIFNELKNKIKEKEEKQKIKNIEKEKKEDSLLFNWNEHIKNQKKVIISQKFKNYDEYIPYTGNPIKFMSRQENIDKGIIKFEYEKIIYSGSFDNNLEEKHYFVISEKNLDLNNNTNFKFRIDTNSSSEELPSLIFGLYDIKNEKNIFDNINDFPMTGLYLIDLESNAFCNGEICYNNDKLNINSIITISYLPTEKILIIKDDKNEITFEQIPNNNCKIRFCFIFKGKDRVTINYNY